MAFTTTDSVGAPSPLDLPGPVAASSAPDDCAGQPFEALLHPSPAPVASAVQPAQDGDDCRTSQADELELGQNAKNPPEAAAEANLPAQNETADDSADISEAEEAAAAMVLVTQLLSPLPTKVSAGKSDEMLSEPGPVKAKSKKPQETRVPIVAVPDQPAAVKPVEEIAVSGAVESNAAENAAETAIVEIAPTTASTPLAVTLEVASEVAASVPDAATQVDSAVVGATSEVAPAVLPTYGPTTTVPASQSTRTRRAEKVTDQKLAAESTTARPTTSAAVPLEASGPQATEEPKPELAAVSVTTDKPEADKSAGNAPDTPVPSAPAIDAPKSETPVAAAPAVTLAPDSPAAAPQTVPQRLPLEILGAAPQRGAEASLPQIDGMRLLHRVARAFVAAEQRDGEVRLRLSPPELGSLRLEVRVQDGAMIARMETETPVARTAIIDSLPALRERLAEQGVRIDRFDVDLMQRPPGGPPDQPSNRQSPETQPNPRPRADDPRRPQPAEGVVARRATFSPDSRGLNVIV